MLPLRMRDVRARVEQAGRAEELGFMRFVRRELELAFRARLLDTLGEISADEPRSLYAQEARKLLGALGGHGTK